MADIGAWEDAEPGVRRRILQAQGALMLMEVQFAADAAGLRAQPRPRADQLLRHRTL
jgi:hypothetical protein